MSGFGGVFKTSFLREMRISIAAPRPQKRQSHRVFARAFFQCSSWKTLGPILHPRFAWFPRVRIGPKSPHDLWRFHRSPALGKIAPHTRRRSARLKRYQRRTASHPRRGSGPMGPEYPTLKTHHAPVVVNFQFPRSGHGPLPSPSSQTLLFCGKGRPHLFP